MSGRSRSRTTPSCFPVRFRHVFLRVIVFTILEVRKMSAINKFTLSLLAMSLVLAVPVLAAGSRALLAAQTQNGITYVTGGIGEPEAAAMKAAAKNYDLVLTFAERRGDYLADVKVNIKDMKGDTLLDIVSGPILLVNLPSGKYTIQAEEYGKPVVKTVDVTSRHHEMFVYAWPNNIDKRASLCAAGVNGSADSGNVC
jgi:hypothetical protein